MGRGRDGGPAGAGISDPGSGRPDDRPGRRRTLVAGCSSASLSGRFKRSETGWPTRTSRASGAAAALSAAWDADDVCLAGLLAKSLAGRAARIAATQCQQVLAGIGFTAEHPFHRFLPARWCWTRCWVRPRITRSDRCPPDLVGTIPRLVDL